jgi:hypothetical protein
VLRESSGSKSTTVSLVGIAYQTANDEVTVAIAAAARGNLLELLLAGGLV